MTRFSAVRQWGKPALPPSLRVFFWYERALTDPTEGIDVASMLMMLRFTKASSPLWSSNVEANEGANR